MMNRAIAITDDVFWVGVNDRETELFESLWPLPRGISYNSYLVKDEKVALIDTVKSRLPMDYLNKIRSVLGEDGTIDYLVINHMEPDHSGSILTLLEIYPKMKLIGNKITLSFLEHFYGITDNIMVVGDGDTLDLGSRQFVFHITPMVHWPETMMTYDTKDRILFSGDAFGGFGALNGGIFDDEVDVDYFEDEILRYFSNIVGKYCNMVSKAIQKLEGLDIGVVASTHGPIWRRSPGTIIDLYRRWSQHEGEEGVVLAYASMYGNTEKMMEAVARGLADSDVSGVRIHNLCRSHVSYAIRDAWRYRGLVLGSPTYDGGLFPAMDGFIRFLKAKKLRKRVLGLFGTYGWSGGGVAALTSFASEGNWRVLEPVIEARCCPTQDDLAQCYTLGSRMAEALREDPVA